jgi:predicted Zn finger-like uncharacterized protein
MVIECPGCHETYTVDMPSMAPDGVEIHCKNCNRSFLIRPHGARRAAENPVEKALPPPTPSIPSDRDGPSLFPEETGTQTELDASLFLQRDEIPYSIVRAYEEIGSTPASAPLEEPEDVWSPPDAPQPLDAEPPDILLDADEMDEPGQMGGLGGDEYFSTPYPLGQDLVVGQKRPKRRLRRWLWGGLVAVLVASLAFLASKCATQAPWQKLKELGQGAFSLLPLNKLDSGKIQISDLNGYFQDRARKETHVFVIEGNVTNGYKSPCHSIQVKGILFDERGNPAAEKIVYCGNVLPVKQIKSSSREKIEQSLQNAYGSTLSNFNIEPGKSVPFMLIFFDPPGKLSEFSLEVYEYTLQDQSGG